MPPRGREIDTLGQGAVVRVDLRCAGSLAIFFFSWYKCALIFPWGSSSIDRWDAWGVEIAERLLGEICLHDQLCNDSINGPFLSGDVCWK